MSPRLECEFELTTRSDNLISMAFNLSNPSADPVTVNYMEPFVDFTLTAMADGRDVEIIQPMYDIGARRVSKAVQAGGTLRIALPFRLQFGSPEPGSTDAMLWTLVHEPASLELRAQLRVNGAAVNPCSAHLEL